MLLFFYTSLMVYRCLKKSKNSFLLRKYLQYRADMQEVYHTLLSSFQIEEKPNIWRWKMEKTKDIDEKHTTVVCLCSLWFKVNMSYQSQVWTCSNFSLMLYNIAREWGANFMSLNRNKRKKSLNLKRFFVW